ncbi:MAG: MarR family transcriptional regulator [Caldicoprobacterales bacterium]|nr:MarR family transcriptional regulator [Clostridiales bacterium]
MEDLYIACHRKLMDLSWRIIKKSRCNLAELGFAWNQYSVLKILEQDQAMTLSEISARVHRKNSNVTPIIDFLVSKGIAERIPDEKDRRIIRVRLTDEGVAIREQAIAHHDNFIRQLYSTLDEEEMKSFMDIVDVFLEKIK